MVEQEVPIAVFCSGSGSNLQALIDGPLHPAKISCVLVNREDAGAIARAERASIPTYIIRHQDHPSRGAFEDKLLGIVADHQSEMVVLAGFMRVLSSHFIRRFGRPVINIHPSLLPSFPGLHAQRKALRAGVKVSGCTVHFVDEGVDTGPILGQAAVPVLEGDTVESLGDRILRQEHRLLPSVVRHMAEKRQFVDAGENDFVASPRYRS